MLFRLRMTVDAVERPARWVRRIARGVLVLTLVSGPMVDPSRADPGDTIRPRQEEVPIYEQPDGSSAVVRRLSTSDRLLEFRRQDGWVKVATHRMLGWGWVRADDVILLRQPPQEPENSKRDGPGIPDGSEQVAEDDPVYFPLLLDIDGSPAVEFRGECLLVTRDDREVRRKFADAIPTQFELEAVAVSCRVRKTDSFGRLRVRLLEDDRVIAWAITTAPFNSVHVWSRGPWGAAGASRGFGALIPAPVRHAAPPGQKTNLRLSPRSIREFRSRQ